MLKMGTIEKDRVCVGYYPARSSDGGLNKSYKYNSHRRIGNKNPTFVNQRGTLSVRF